SCRIRRRSNCSGSSCDRSVRQTSLSRGLPPRQEAGWRAFPHFNPPPTPSAPGSAASQVGGFAGPRLWQLCCLHPQARVPRVVSTGGGEGGAMRPRTARRMLVWTAVPLIVTQVGCAARGAHVPTASPAVTLDEVDPVACKDLAEAQAADARDAWGRQRVG